MYCDLAKGASLALEKRFRVVCLNDNIPAIEAVTSRIMSLSIDPRDNSLIVADFYNYSISRIIPETGMFHLVITNDPTEDSSGVRWVDVNSSGDIYFTAFNC